MPFDLKLTDLDLTIAGGDFVTGESTYDHQQVLLLADKGQLKQNPAMGVGIRHYLEDYTAERLAAAIRTQFTKDGMSVEKIEFNEAKAIIDAYYEED